MSVSIYIVDLIPKTKSYNILETLKNYYFMFIHIIKIGVSCSIIEDEKCSKLFLYLGIPS